jgi:hypothetical protein
MVGIMTKDVGRRATAAEDGKKSENQVPLSVRLVRIMYKLKRLSDMLRAFFGLWRVGRPSW